MMEMASFSIAILQQLTMAKTRRSARTPGPSGNPRRAKQTRASALANNCLELAFDIPHCCSGCQFFYDTIPPERRYMLKQLLAKRHTSHTSRRFQCTKPWETDLEDAQTSQIHMVDQQLKQLKVGRRSLFIERTVSNDDNEEDSGATNKTSEECDTADSATSPSSCSASSSDSEKEPNLNPELFATKNSNTEKTKKPVYMELFSHTIRSQGVEYVVENVPKTHAVVPKAHLKRLQNKEKKLTDLEKQFKRKRFPDVSMGTKTTIAMALVSVPALALKAAQYFIPSIVAAFLLESKILNYKTFDALEFARSFPSEFYFRSLMFEQAAKCLVSFAVELRDKRVFLSCDKGNKKGVGHFVKMLSYWNDSKSAVEFKCLDMDASEGDTNACAEAIEHSLKSVGAIRLQGSTTDSGGGGVLDSLANALEAKGICQDNYKVAGCSIHAFQLTLAVPTQKILGEGGLGMKNVMQLIHSVYDMQEALDFDEYVEIMDKARAFVRKMQANKNADYDYGDSATDKDFGEKMSKVISFYKDFQSTDFDLNSRVRKMAAPVLTRWWYVGEACKYVWQNYPAIVKATQMVINIYGTKPNKIASGLQPLLLEPEIFSDLALLRSYHVGFFDHHLKWLQDSIDMSNRPGFQSHQMLARYFLMQQDLRSIQSTILTSHPSFKEFRDSIATFNMPELKAVQERKVALFLDLAIDSLDKHFTRWANEKLVPAALLSQYPLAQAVARRMLCVAAEPARDKNTERFFVSTVHCRVFDMFLYDTFLSNIISADAVYDSLDISAAQSVLSGDDPRDLTAKKRPASKHLLSMYLPLACHTQGVESAVKEAKLVSPTGRHEPLRSAYAIVRSHLVLSTDGGLSSIASSERAALLLECAQKQQRIHERLEKGLGSTEYIDLYKNIRTNIHADHFKGVRVGRLKAKVHTKGNINKKENALQKSQGVNRTAATLGLIPYSSVAKNRGHQAALEEELLFRKIKFDSGGSTLFNKLKKLLLDHELARVSTTGNEQDISAAKKSFRKLSNAIFIGIET